MEGRTRPAHVAPKADAPPASVAGAFVDLEGESYYRISAFDRLTPFLMSLPSDTDLWMFVTSGGGLTAGRVDPDGSLFPYRTVDELHDAHHHTGPITLLRVGRDHGASMLWEPLAGNATPGRAVERNLYKNTVGNRLLFEETRHDLGLTFRYRWSACDEFGWVRSVSLQNHSEHAVELSLLDGLRNILPFGAPLSLYQQAGNLVDAYKKSEVDPLTGLGIFSLTAGITDRAEALEILRANTVWCCGLDQFQVALSPAALESFRAGDPVPVDRVRNGVRGNYFVTANLKLPPGEERHWHIVADAGLDHVRISALRRRLLDDRELIDRIEPSLERARESLWRIVASADGVQLSGRPESWCHHFANVLFNGMRGGVFLRNHEIPATDLAASLAVRNRAVADRHARLLDQLPAGSTVSQVRAVARETGDADLERLVREYLPLYFSRRHGDPSRPWNRFTIRARDRARNRDLHYEGNWRDIFQNWEALGYAFPGFLPSMVARFLNASTADGFNPYRVTQQGVDWETVSSGDPWSNIGYWGDHQIVYLLRLLEAMDRFHPSEIDDLLGVEIFSYVDIPYRSKPYAALLRNPSSTIEFDHERAAGIEERVRRQGTDGKLLQSPAGAIYHANLFEKLLVPALSKLSNLVPGAGIWMNTQRPEWNDANNALAAGGISVVTLCYLRRYLAFLADRLTASATLKVPVSREVADWLDSIAAVLESEQQMLPTSSLAPHDRKRLMDALGEAFSGYRERVYAHGFSGKVDVSVQRGIDLCQLALRFVDAGLAANRRADGLFHSYHVLHLTQDQQGVEVVPLPEMLEGQVAALSSGCLEPPDALELLQQLFRSALYRPDQRSFLLQPERELPGFLAKNVLENARVEAIPLLKDLLAAEDRSLLARDEDGVVRFCSEFRAASDVVEALDRLGARARWARAVERDRGTVLELFEDVFRHRSYTGRSGVMYAYEGLGCIYWHMVAKLLVAVQENVLRAVHECQAAHTRGPHHSFGQGGRSGAAPHAMHPSVRDDLARMYFRIRAGLGYEKSAAEYGAFPTDPYSHTPGDGGAKQPGMTGQVKEEILTRAGELGILVVNGALRFEPFLLRAREFLQRPASFRYVDVDGGVQAIPLPTGSLAFTFCQVPVVYERVVGDPWIRVVFRDGFASEAPGGRLDPALSAEVFARSGRIECIRVGVSERQLCAAA
jgi:hypothetical protein